MVKFRKDRPSVNIILGIFILTAVGFLLIVLFYLKKVSLLQIVVVSVLTVIVTSLIFIGKNIRKWFEEKKVIRRSLTPKIAAQLVKQFYLNELVEHVDVELRRTFFPKVKEGRDKVCRFYVTFKSTGKRIAIKVPLDRGKAAILEGDMNFDDDLDLMYDKKEDSMFSPEVTTETFIEQIQELDPDVARSIFAQQAIQNLFTPTQQTHPQTGVVPKVEEKEGEE